MDSARAFNAYFQEKGFAIEASAHRAEREFLEGFGEWIEEALANGSDVWIEYAV